VARQDERIALLDLMARRIAVYDQLTAGGGRAAARTAPDEPGGDRDGRHEQRGVDVWMWRRSAPAVRLSPATIAGTWRER
jgi:hypothetical protein